MSELMPCKCGSIDITHWGPELSSDRVEQITAIEKIECNLCGTVVYDGGADGIIDWNNQNYCYNGYELDRSAENEPEI